MNADQESLTWKANLILSLKESNYFSVSCDFTNTHFQKKLFCSPCLYYCDRLRNLIFFLFHFLFFNFKKKGNLVATFTEAFVFCGSTGVHRRIHLYLALNLKYGQFVFVLLELCTLSARYAVHGKSVVAIVLRLQVHLYPRQLPAQN